MTIVFWIGVSWLAYVYIGYPLVLWILGLLRPVRPRVDETYRPTVSVLISAYNEEKDIGWKVRETLAWDYPPDKLQVLVASDASTDRTDEIIQSVKDPRLTFVRMEQRGGKNAALNRLAELASGDLLLFTDANSHIEPTAVCKLVRHFGDPQVGCVTGIEGVSAGTMSTLESGGKRYLGYEAVLNTLESKLGSVLVCDGSVFCMRHRLFTPLSPDLANDLESPLRIGAAGYWVLFDPAVRSSEKPTQSPREEFQRRRRICGQGLLGMYKLRTSLRGLRGWQFLSRKFLRWLTLIPMLLVLVASLGLRHRSIFQLLLAAQVAAYALAVLGGLWVSRGKRASTITALPFYCVLVPLAAFVGVVQTCYGRRFHIWQVATLSRGSDGSCGFRPA